MIHAFMEQILPWLADLGAWGYWLALLVAICETTIGIGPLLPGSTIILFLGALAARGYLHFYPLLAFAILGAIIGDNINFALGKKYGRRWLAAGLWFLKASHFQSVRSFIADHGPKSIFLARFLPSGKELVPFIAGVGQMDGKLFLLWNVLGAMGWGLEWAGVGYLFGQSLSLAELWLSRAGFFVALLLLGLLLLSLGKWLLLRAGREAWLLFRGGGQALLAAFAAWPAAQRWWQRHVPARSWLAARWRPDALGGRPLTLLFLFCLPLLAAVAWGGISLRGSSPPWAWERSASNLIAAWRSDTLTALFSWLTLLGERKTIAVFTLLAMALFLLLRRFAYPLPLLLGVVGGELATSLLQQVVRRSRPPLPLYVENAFSYPSAHATLAVVFFGFLAYLFIRATPSWSRKVNLFFATLLLLLAVGLSRFYLGGHYPSDIVAGYLVGGVCLALAIVLAEWRRLAGAGGARPPGPAAWVGVGALLLLGLLFVVVQATRYRPPLAPVAAEVPAVLSAALDIFAGEQHKYTETIFGERQEPLNFLFLVQEEGELLAALEKAGWQRLANVEPAALARTARAWLARDAAVPLPISPTFWQGKIQDYSYSRPSSPPRLYNAHRLRLWRSNATTAAGARIILGLANATDGLQWGCLPQLSPALDVEREFLGRELAQAASRVEVEKRQLLPPTRGKNFIGASFTTDGRIWIVTLAE